jgi:hypothetical protein
MAVSRRTLPLLVVALLGFAAAPAHATPVSQPDPADTPYGAPDILLVAADSDPAGTLTVAARFAPRPPAGWGVCVPFVPGSPTCFPPDMRVDWLIDSLPGTGSPADGGADARVTGVPSGGQTVFELARWDASRGWVTGPLPQVAQSGGNPTIDVGWQALYASLGLSPGATIGVRVVTSYRSITGLGIPTAYSDAAPDSGWITVVLAGTPPAVAAGPLPKPSAACTSTATAANAVQRQLARARARTHSRRAGVRKRARREVKRLLKRRKALRAKLTKTCPKPAPASTPAGAAPPSTAGPSCHYVTKLTYVLGLDGKYRLQERVVLACT